MHSSCCCPKFVLAWQVKKIKTHVRKMIEDGYFQDTEVFGTPLVGKGKGTPCLFCQESVKKVILV